MAQEKPFYTPEEYLALERASETKHEYYLGDMYAMAGGTPQHSAITANVIGMLYAQLRGSPARSIRPF